VVVVSRLIDVVEATVVEGAGRVVDDGGVVVGGGTAAVVSADPP
jgi:hypothetical protein